MSKQADLDAIKADILQNNVCPNLAAQATQLVFAAGSPNAKIVFIGEAPGKKEDQTGLPFVGAAGKFLDEMLASINLKRSDIYITNIVKYRPPENRDPTTQEKTAFLPYLVRQLEVIQPKLVITLGRHSMEAFLPGLKISQTHGQPIRIRLQLSVQTVGDKGEYGLQEDKEKRTSRTNGTTSESRTKSTPQAASKLSSDASSAGSATELTLVLLPLYHPAAALYNGGLRQNLKEDFANIPAVINKLQEY